MTQSDRTPAPSARLTWIVYPLFFLTFGSFAFVAWQHITYPGYTEVMEGDALLHMEQIIKGSAIYREPSGDYIPLVYLPLYYYASVPFYLVFDGFTGPRILSTFAAILAGVLVGFAGWRETRSRELAIVASSFFFAGYRIMDGYLTCGMPESLLLLWIMLGYVFFAYGTRRVHEIAWMVCFTLAFWTKQQGAFFFGFAVLYALLFPKRLYPRWVYLLGLIVGGPVLYFLIGPFLGERFFYFTLLLPSRWEQSLLYAVPRVVFVTGLFLPLLLLLSAYEFKNTISIPLHKCPPSAWFVLSSLVGVCITMRVAGSSNNHFIPLTAGLCITATAGLKRIADGVSTAALLIPILGLIIVSGCIVFMTRNYTDHPVPKFVPFVITAVFGLLGILKLACRNREATRTITVLILIAGQVATCAYNPLQYATADDFSATASKLQAELKALNAPVIHAHYGKVPSRYCGFEFEKMPSTVSLEDTQNQKMFPENARADISAFRQNVESRTGNYVITINRIENEPVWNKMAPFLELVRDFGQDYAAMRQTGFHWYSGGEYPRFLYRIR